MKLTIKKLFSKKKCKRNLMVSGVLVGLSVISFFFSDIVYAINSLTSGFRIETTAVQDVESGELCTKITNNDVKPLFIPTNTQEELQSFLDHPPSSIVYEDCVSCPKSQISVDKYTSKVIGTADGNFLMITYGYNGYFSEYAVSKVNTEGQVIWKYTAKNTYYISDILELENAYIFKVYGGGYPYTYLLFSVDLNGNYIAGIKYNSSTSPNNAELLKDGTNTFVDTTSGHLVRFNQNLSLLGSIDQSIFYYINALEKTTDNGYLASGYYGIVKFSSSGMIEWKKMYKYPYVYSSGTYYNNLYIDTIQSNGNGQYLVTAYIRFEYGSDSMAFLIDNNGNIVGGKKYNGYDYSGLVSIMLSDGYLLGSSSSTEFVKFLSNGTQAWKKTTASNSVLFDTAGGYGIKTRNGVNSAFEDYGETCEEGVSYTASTAFSALASMQVENVGTYTAQSHNHSFSTVSDYSPYISQGAADFSCSTPPLTSETWCEQAPTTPTIWLAWTNTNPVLVYGQNATDPNPGDTVTYYWSTSAGSLSSTTTTGSNGVQITFPSGHPTFTVSVYAKDQKGYTSATTTATYAWVSSGFYSNQQVLSSWECMFGYKTGGGSQGSIIAKGTWNNSTQPSASQCTTVTGTSVGGLVSLSGFQELGSVSGYVVWAKPQYTTQQVWIDTSKYVKQ